MAMNLNDMLDQALMQARDMQRQMGEAVTQAAEQMKPQIEQTIGKARELQEKLSRHATETGEVAASQTVSARGYVNDFIRMGTDAMRESAEQARATALKMAEQSRKIVEAMSVTSERPK